MHIFIVYYYTSYYEKIWLILHRRYSCYFGCRKDLSIPLNYSVFSYKKGDKQGADKHYRTFEHRLREKMQRGDKDFDETVQKMIQTYIARIEIC